MDMFNCSIVISDCTGGNPENTNGGAYKLRACFLSPMVGVYLYRECWSYHGDIEPMPDWEQVSLPEYYRLFKAAQMEAV